MSQENETTIKSKQFPAANIYIFIQAALMLLNILQKDNVIRDFHFGLADESNLQETLERDPWLSSSPPTRMLPYNLVLIWYTPAVTLATAFCWFSLD